MSSLKADIIGQIHSDGPMRLDRYMQICLLHPTKGYYTTQPPFGREGDFITAPEVSQMFGELLGLWIAQCWLTQGSPARFTLAELGPGRGTLMADALRACARVPGLHEAAEVVLVEASPALRQVQAGNLNAHQITWVEDIADLPQQPLYLIANEFFDALPQRQFIRTGEGWRERCIGVEGDQLIWGLGPVGPQAELDTQLETTPEGALQALCPALADIMPQTTQRIADHGGAGLIVDYGDWDCQGDTFQAVQDHARADPLADPGQADLTAHVDFAALAALASPALHTQLTPQGIFLERLGITDRAQKLATGLAKDALLTHIAAHRRLTHPEEMGNLFKVMGLYPPATPVPPGFDT